MYIYIYVYIFNPYFIESSMKYSIHVFGFIRWICIFPQSINPLNKVFQKGSWRRDHQFQTGKNGGDLQLLTIISIYPMYYSKSQKIEPYFSTKL